MDLRIDFSPEELAAIDAQVTRQQDNEPGLTAADLMTRMTRKIARGWSDQMASTVVADALRKFEAAVRTAPPAKVAEALKLVGVADDAVEASPVVKG